MMQNKKNKKQKTTRKQTSKQTKTPLLSVERKVVNLMVNFPRNTKQLNIFFLPSSMTSLKALISFPKGNRKSMKTSTSQVSQVLQRGNRKSMKISKVSSMVMFVKKMNIC